MAYDPTFPQDNTPATAVAMRDQLNALKALHDQLAAQVAAVGAMFPVGCIAGYLKGLPQVPALPGAWVECNGQIINDAGSLLNGTNAPDLNGVSGPRRFLRGASASGGTGGAETHAHNFSLPPAAAGGVVADADPVDWAVDGTTQSASSLPSYYEVVWVMRVK